MEYVKFGNTGLDVSRLSLGTMGFGDPVNWVHRWALNETDSRPVIKKALDLGINFFDTANMYANGVSEEILGNALKDFARREEVVIETKVFWKMFDGPNAAGLSRKAIMTEVDNSLRRLRTDYIDIYVVHRWDYNTPIEETMEALHDLVKMGKVRYLGASNMYAWQFQKAQNVAEKHGWTKFVSMQDHLNLIYREEEREMLPYCEDTNIAITPYSPLAAGRLTRDRNESSLRLETDKVAVSKYGSTEDVDAIIIDRVGEVAAEKNVSRSDIALAWLLQKKQVVAPIIGATKMSHLDTAVKALSVNLTPEEVHYLEEAYQPHPVVGAN
ncbi:aldo/keto reductase [Leuconostoc gasicomitatum]|uniref:Aldo/keto reductase n=1 Tax=Leuconostoc gasicomitatum TaxID=115778 RepID=A0A9Q3SZE7_9LACO|nr:aldo/keto reductase [Leuconostoc gasicomitatum]MBZ5962901.1 aldo/keto reductase [Leuconostoc gasicomitatum]